LKALRNVILTLILVAERGSPKYERAAMRWLEHLAESSPRLGHFAEIAASLAQREA